MITGYISCLMRRKILFILFMLAAGTLLFGNSGGAAKTIEPSWISLLPPLTAITLAMVTKQAHVSLYIGILIGACFITGGVVLLLHWIITWSIPWRAAKPIQPF